MRRNLLMVFRGTATAQLLGLAVLPILTRLFAPEAFGKYQVYQAILSALVIIASLRLEMLILRARAEDVTPIVRSAIAVALLFSLVVAVAVFLAKAVAGEALSLSGFPVPLIAVGLFLSGAMQAYSYVLTREHDFVALVRIKIIQAVAYALVAIAVGLLWQALVGLIVADIAGRLASVAVIHLHARRRSDPLLARGSLRPALLFAWEHRHAPLISAPGAFLNATGAAITPIMMYVHFSASVSGQFAVVQSAIGLPVAMIVASVSQVYIAQLSQQLRDHDIRAVALTNRVTVWAALPASIAVILIPFLPSLFVWAFGESWRVAGRFAQLLTPAYGVALAYGAMNSSLLAMGRYKVQLAWDTAWPLSFGLVWLVVVAFRLPAEWAVGLHSLALCALGLSFIALVHCLLRRHDFSANATSGPVSSGIGEPGATN